MKFILALLSFSVMFLFQGDAPILWDGVGHLTWDDFRGAPEMDTDAAATTVSALSYNFQGYIQGNELVYVYDVKAYFFPDKSWVRPGMQDEELLLHEQLHFDITAWYASKLRKAFDTITPSADPEEKVRAVYKQIQGELDSVQLRYDKQTDYSRNTREQLLWQSRIKAYLNRAYD
ncbi:DUF922 domain-containing protein [Robertkochia flava]|uniref:DUF922 domain-containing protein n=1 Tax=Robertkochia flava TaxID=3447986 RepID=UPI001CCB0D0E|nr:DUF922 domain-containing protein [Robertkochia marina]